MKLKTIPVIILLIVLAIRVDGGAPVQSPKGKEVFKPSVTVPQLPPVKAVVLPAVTNSITLAWDDPRNPVGTKYRVAYGQDKNSLTNTVDAGSATTLTIINLPTVRHWYGVRAYNEKADSRLSGIVSFSPWSALVKSPPDIVRSFWCVLPDSSKVILGSTTNTPPGASGFYRVQYLEDKDYSP